MLNKDMFIKPQIALEGEPHEGEAKVEERLVACPSCKRASFDGEYKENYNVCPQCGFHMPMPSRTRIEFLADENTFIEHDENAEAVDRIEFPQYFEKLEKARQVSGEKEAVITGRCSISGQETCLFVMNSAFMMGSMSPTVGDKITSLFEYALENRLPVVGITVSGGARVHEGILSLMQMAKTSGAVKRHSDAGLFYLVLLTNPTTGGVTASFAMEGDIILSEPYALIGFAGPRVIEQTIRQKLPEGFQRAEFLMEKGFVDNIVARKEQKETIAMLLSMHKQGGDIHASV